MIRALSWTVALSIATLAGTARAGKEHLDVGEAVKNFTLKVVNPDEAGVPYVGIDSFYGPEAKTPKKAMSGASSVTPQIRGLRHNSPCVRYSGFDLCNGNG